MQPDINVLLTASVEGIGEKGEVVSMRPNAAYYKVLLPGLGTYSEIKGDETKERLVSETFNAKRVSWIDCYDPIVLHHLNPLAFPDRQHAPEPSRSDCHEQRCALDVGTVAYSGVVAKDGNLHPGAGHHSASYQNIRSRYGSSK